MSSKNISLQVSKSPTTSTTSTSGPLFWGLVVWIPWKWKGTNLPLVETSNPQTKTSNFYITYITQKKLHPWIHKHEDCWKIPIHVQYLNRKYTDSTQNLGCCQLARHVKGTSGGETSAHLEVLPGLRLTWSRSGRETSLSVHMEHPRPWGGWKSPQLRWGGWLVGWLEVTMEKCGKKTCPKSRHKAWNTVWWYTGEPYFMAYENCFYITV